MHVPSSQTHFNSARLLFQQRTQWQNQAQTKGAALERLESFLRLHLHVLARCDEPAPGFGDTAAAFVSLAKAFVSPNEEVQAQARDKALQLLLEDLTVREGVLSAMSLRPESNVPESESAFYDQNPSARRALFDLWALRGSRVHPERLHEALHQDRDQELRQAAFAYAAFSPFVTLAKLRPWYQPLQTKTALNRLPADLLIQALWGGLLRGDEELPNLLMKAYEQQGDKTTRHAILTQAALGGFRQFEGLMLEYARVNPSAGWPLLALYGYADLLPELIEERKQTADRASADQTWQWLTGKCPPPQTPPSLHKGPSSPSEDTPEKCFFSQWVEANAPGFGNETRLAFGKPLDLTHLQTLFRTEAGQAGDQLWLMLSIARKAPLKYPSRMWRTTLCQALDSVPEEKEALHASP